MPAHDFDKTLKEKAQNLRIDPSPRVWEGIAEELHRKRRRRGAAWIFTAAAVLTGITFFALENSGVLSSAGDKQRPLTESSAQATSASSETTKTSTTKNAAIENNATLPVTTSSSSDQELPENKTARLSDASKRKQWKAASNYNSRVELSQVIIADEEVVAEGPELFGATVRGLDFNRAVNAPNTPSKRAGDNKLDSRLTENKKLSRPDRWHVAITVGAGTSSLVSGGFQQYNSFLNEYNSAVSIPAGIAAIQQRPSDVKAGPAFMAGVQLSHNLSKKLRVGIGLQYQYNSNRIKLGRSIDSTVSIYTERMQAISSQRAYKAAGNSGESFYNQYHFISVPLEFTWNFDQKQRWYASAGASVGLLAGVNAFHYNNNAGVYYRNNDVYNRWQTSLNAGVQYRISRGNTAPVWIGPFVTYQLSKLDNSLSDKHLLMLGVGARMQIK